MIVLDTNVVSELMRVEPAVVVVEWVDRQPASDVYLTAVTLAELLYGIARLPDGRRKTTLAELLDAMVAEDFEHRVVAFDEIAAVHYVDIVVRRVITGAWRSTDQRGRRADRGDLSESRRGDRHA